MTPRTADDQCTTLVAKILVPDPLGTLFFVNHFPSWWLNFELERELQAAVAAQFIEEHVAQGNVHVVLVGDLDADPGAASVRFWSGRQALAG